MTTTGIAAAQEKKQKSLFDSPDGAELRDRGIAQAEASAGPSWKADALRHLRRFIHENPTAEFMTEDLREWAYSRGLSKPPSDRAWGGVITSAQRLGLIEHVRFAATNNPSAHRTPASVWRPKR